MSALQKGKKKVEEVAAKAKDAITTNGHDTDGAKSNGTPANDESTETANHDHAEPGASEEPAKVAPSTQEADATVEVTQSPQAVGETAVH